MEMKTVEPESLPNLQEEDIGPWGTEALAEEIRALSRLEHEARLQKGASSVSVGWVQKC